LRDVGVVVEYLGGIDDLPAIVADFSPGPVRRLRSPRRSPRRRVEGDQDRGAGAITARADRRASLHRRLGRGQAGPGRHPRLAGDSARLTVEGRRAAGYRLAAGHRGSLAAYLALGNVFRGPRA